MEGRGKTYICDIVRRYPMEGGTASYSRRMPLVAIGYTTGLVVVDWINWNVTANTPVVIPYIK